MLYCISIHLNLKANYSETLTKAKDVIFQQVGRILASKNVFRFFSIAILTQDIFNHSNKYFFFYLRIKHNDMHVLNRIWCILRPPLESGY